jgi:DNA-binding MarR family transcriptional regulator
MSKQHYQASTYRAQESIGYLVKRSHSLMLDMLEPLLEVHGFSFIQYVMLAWLRDGIAINPKSFCALYRHDTGALTRVIDQLAERGLLVRVRRDVGDRRKIELELTSAGRDAVEQMIPMVVDKLNLALGEFSAAEFEELRRLLIKLNTTMQTAIQPAGAAAEA